MSLGVQIVYQDNVTPAVRELAASLAPAQLNPVVGESVKQVYRDHLFAKNQSSANALGGPRTNYYARAGESVSWWAVPEGVIISISAIGLALHYFGGTVRPVKAKYLTIPARAEAHGKRASEFKDLQLLWGRNGPYALARRVSTAITVGRRNANGIRAIGRGKVQGGEIYFWLVKEVTQKPDPTVLPSQEVVPAKAVNRTVLDVAHRAWARGADAPKLTGSVN